MGTADSTGYIPGLQQGKEMSRRMKNMIPWRYVAGILVLLLLVIPASAHPPSDLALSYQPGDLAVTITHNVANASAHYVYRVTILVNGVPLDTILYESQSSDNRFTYQYPVNGAPGDAIEVTADCNIGGSISRTVVVGTETAPETPPLVLWPYHALFQVLGFSLLIAAVLLVQFGRKVSGWYRWQSAWPRPGQP
jgi:hypothetical protein